jgi:prolyl oligopeptidase
VLQEGVDGWTTARVGRDGRLYLFTDVDAPRRRLAVADPREPRYPNWTDVIAEDRDSVLTDWTLLDRPDIGRWWR